MAVTIDGKALVVAGAFEADGLNAGVATSVRLVGGTASGAPTQGTFALGDLIVDQTGTVRICKTAGTPGTWSEPTINTAGAPFTVTGDPPALATQAAMQAGGGAFDGSAGAFSGAAAGTVFGANLKAGSTADFVNLQIGGVSGLQITAAGHFNLAAGAITDTLTAGALNYGPANATQINFGVSGKQMQLVTSSGAVTIQAGGLTVTAGGLTVTAGNIAAAGNTLTIDQITVTDAKNIVLGSTTGTQIGTATTQKLGFYGAAPVVQIAGATDVLAGLVTLGLRAASANPPLNLGTGALTSGTISSGAITVTSTSASALAVGANGSTNPVLQINANTASVATGIDITGAAAAGGVAIAAISSGAAENVTLDAKGSGTVTIGGISTGGVVLGSGSTAVTKVVVYSASLTPAATAGVSAVEQTFAVSGLTTADKVLMNYPAQSTGAVPVACRVTAANTIGIMYINPTAVSATSSAGTYLFVAIRS